MTTGPGGDAGTGPPRIAIRQRIAEYATVVLVACAGYGIWLAFDESPAALMVQAPIAGLGAIAAVYALRLAWLRRRSS